MLQNLFNYDNPVWHFIGKLGDIIILNILWTICSIPLFTIGASTTALYYCTLKLVRDEENGTIRMFFKSFKENFRQATIIWLLMAFVGLILGFDLYFFVKLYQGGGAFRFALQSITGALCILWFLIFTFVFAVLARFVNTVKRTLINALLMAVRHLGTTLTLVLSDIGLLVIAYFSLYYVPQLTAVFLLLGWPLIAWLNSYYFEKIFKHYMPEEPKLDHQLRPILQDEPYGNQPESMQAAEQSAGAAPGKQTGPGDGGGASDEI